MNSGNCCREVGGKPCLDLGGIGCSFFLPFTDGATTNTDDIRKHAAELAALAPDVILADIGTTTVAPLLQATRTVPIVFVKPDPDCFPP